MSNQFYSQVGQDKWVCDFFNYKRDGYFLELGAFDGIELSNTYYLEKELGWQGICVEASPENFSKLEKNRSCICLPNAVYKKNTRLYFASGGLGGGISSVSHENDPNVTVVDALTVGTILKQHNAPKIIDYISLDIEGNEVDALLGFPFDEYEVILWTIEHNLHVGMKERLAKSLMNEIMARNGFTIVRENVGTSARYPMEDFFVNNKYLKK